MSEPRCSPSDTPTEAGIAATPGSDDELARVRDGVMQRLFGDPVPQRLLGRYTLVKRIGRGGMGEVHLAEDPELGRRVAIKLLSGYAHEPSASTRRLLHEARAVAKLAHPHVVEVFDVGVQAGVPFVVMELVEGGTFADWLAAQPRSPAEIVAALLDAAAGLAAAHAAGLLHRDFKPANVLVGLDGRMRVADFGLALGVAKDGPTAAFDDVDAEASTLELGGTPAFMPPEQHAAQPLDASADVYAFCATLYQACYGVLPFRGNLPAIVAAKLDYDGTPPAGRRIDARLHAVIARGLHPDRTRRWRSIDALVDALRRTQRGSRARTAAIVGLPVLVIAGVSWLALRSGPAPTCDDEAALSEVWAPARRAELASTPAIAGSERGAAVLAAIDARAQQWRAAYQQACEVPPVRRDAVMTCLGRRRSALAATLVLLTEGDRELDARAIDLVDTDDVPTSCLTVEADAADPVRTGLLAELGSVDALDRAGRHQQADEAASALLLRAREHGDATSIAAVALASGRARAQLGDETHARERVQEALWSATSRGDDVLAFEAALELAWIEGTEAGNPELAEDYARQAEASLVRSGDDPRRRARLDMTMGAVWGMSHAYARAEPLLRRALAHAEQVGDARMANDAHRDLGALALHADRIDEALAELGAAAAWYERELGDGHPAYVDALATLAQAELQHGDGGRARATIARAVELGRASLGEQHPSTIEALGVQGHVLSVLDDVEGALASSRAALAAMIERFGPDDRRVSAVETRLADLLGRGGDLDQAIVHAEHALLIEQQAYGSESVPAATAMHYLARVRGMRGDAQADALFEHATRIFAAGGDVEREVMLMNDHAQTLAARDRTAEALALTERAWARAADLGPRSFARAGTGMHLAMLDERRPLAERRALVTAARETWAAAGVDAQTLAFADGWLAEHPP